MKVIGTEEATAVIADFLDSICDTYHSFDESDILRRMNANAVDAEPVKRGMWTFIRLTDKDYGYKAKECSLCGSTFFDTKQWNYCPNCGADMRTDDEKTNV